MAAVNAKPAQTGFSRAFIIENGAGPGNSPAYQGLAVPGAISQSFGDITKIEIPDPNRYDSFLEIGQVKGENERATSSLVGRYALDIQSEILRLAQKGCEGDIHINLGDCTDPSSPNQFKKKIIQENVSFTSYETDDLGALGSTDRAEVNETGEYSIKTWYEILRMKFASRAGDILTNEVVDIVVCDNLSCGDCDDPSDGCQAIFAITKAAGGSASTPADVAWSLDGGSTWQVRDVDTLGAAEEPTGLACVGDYLVIISNDSNSLHYALLSEFTATGANPTWTEVTTGFVSGGEPNDIWSVGQMAFIVGDTGYVYKTDDPTAGVEVLDAGVATSNNLQAVHAIDDQTAVAVGATGSVISTSNQSTWAANTSSSSDTLQAIWMIKDDLWWIGSDAGNLYYTKDSGTTWTAKTFTGSGSGAIHDINFPTKSVGYIAHASTTPAGRLLRTYDGGNSFVVLPEDVGNLPASDRITAIATCSKGNISAAVNKIFCAGLADDGSDGFLMVGEN